MGKWTIPPEKVKARIMADLIQVVKAAYFITYQRIHARSPVLTGQFRGNWQTSLNTPPAATPLEKFDPSGAEGLRQAFKVVDAYRPGDTIYMRDYIPYGPRLEDGYSKKAPDGFLLVTVSEWPQIVSIAAKDIRR
jgi:hypothetical protein